MLRLRMADVPGAPDAVERPSEPHSSNSSGMWSSAVLARAMLSESAEK